MSFADDVYLYSGRKRGKSAKNRAKKMFSIRRFKFCAVEEGKEGAKSPLARVTRARLPWEICFFAFTTFTEGEKKDGKRGRKEGTPAVAMLDKNGMKILELYRDC